ncbi:MAG: hypothetical protein Q8898_09380 [Bacillota bacterium]|nr:hypothetical protein [Bacillota bacterium]
MDYRQFLYMPELQYEFDERQSPYGWPGGGQQGTPFPGSGGGFPGGGQPGSPFPGSGGGFPGGGQPGSPFPGSGGGFPGGGQPGSPFPGSGGGFPGGGQPGSPFPGGGGSHGGAPTSPPPSYTPQEQVSQFAVDPGAIRRCLYRYTFIWLHNGRSFWFYPTYVGRTSIAGYRWRGFRWVYYGTDLNRIRSFRCS